MKYKVVGWTSYDDSSVEDSGNRIGFAERNAIIDDIKAHGYLFSGYDHQEMFDCAPVLNDGKRRCFSQRGWGGVMAEAHGYFGAYDYSLFTFGVNEEYAKRPKDYFFPDSFTPEDNLAEHFEIDVDESIFAYAKSKNPFFLPDFDELRYIDAGDTLTLRCGAESACFYVADIDRSPSGEGAALPYKIETKLKISVTLLKADALPTPTDESRALAAMLDKLAAEYAAIFGEGYRERKKQCFEKCRQLAEMLHTSGEITLYAGDCAFSALYDSISKESGHFTATNVFCTDSESSYIMGVCRESTPLFRKLGKDEVGYQAENRWGKIGVYYKE